jgi:dTDP-4-amino-4,6-dideoxygalactose transaminase
VNISKIATDRTRFTRSFQWFTSARSALKALLAFQQLRSDEVVLLPAYVGWSPREGSGVFDPIKELGLAYAFYRIDDRLNIDLEHLERLLRGSRVRIVILVHYFGRVDARAVEAAALARQSGAFVIEDSAHAMLSDLVTGAAGCIGDASIFSLHKLLPVSGGGLLMLNGTAPPQLVGPAGDRCVDNLPWNFDLRAISNKRCANLERLQELVDDCGDAEPLWGRWPANCVPQTFPVLVNADVRDRVYREMNASGYGVVSLYHTLIDAIAQDQFPASHEVSRRILNLPVHQDVDAGALPGLIRELEQCVTHQPRPV